VPASAPGPIPSTGAGKVSVQLATLFYGKLVTYERHRLQKLLPSLLGSRELVVSKCHRGGRTRWLVRTGGFDNSTQAAEFCQPGEGDRDRTRLLGGWTLLGVLEKADWALVDPVVAVCRPLIGRSRPADGVLPVAVLIGACEFADGHTFRRPVAAGSERPGCPKPHCRHSTSCISFRCHMDKVHYARSFRIEPESEDLVPSSNPRYPPAHPARDL